jgi:hypothetical protein
VAKMRRVRTIVRDRPSSALPDPATLETKTMRRCVPPPLHHGLTVPPVPHRARPRCGLSSQRARRETLRVPRSRC